MTTFDHGYALLLGVDQNAVSEWALPDVGKDIVALKVIYKNLPLERLQSSMSCGIGQLRIRWAFGAI